MSGDQRAGPSRRLASRMTLPDFPRQREKAVQRTTEWHICGQGRAESRVGRGGVHARGDGLMPCVIGNCPI